MSEASLYAPCARMYSCQSRLPWVHRVFQGRGFGAVVRSGIGGFGFRISGFGFRVSGFGFPVSDFGCRRDWVFEFRVEGRFGVENFRVWG